MPCLLVLIAFFFPRLVIALLALLTTYMSSAYPNGLMWPLLGFFFLPYTTLAYAWAMNSHGSVEGIHLVVVILAVLSDLGVVGSGARTHRTRSVAVAARRD